MSGGHRQTDDELHEQAQYLVTEWASISDGAEDLVLSKDVRFYYIKAILKFLVFINDLSDSLKNPLYLFADDSTPRSTICHPSNR